MGNYIFLWSVDRMSTEALGAEKRFPVRISNTFDQDGHDIPIMDRTEFVVYMGLSALFMRLTGTNYKMIAPVDVTRVGPFSKASLQALPNKSTSMQRRRIQMFGQLYGCHHCGSTGDKVYVADHMPPNKYYNEKVITKRRGFWRSARASGDFRLPFSHLRTRQRLYPQCYPCSATQALALGSGARFPKRLIYPSMWRPSTLVFVPFCLVVHPFFEPN